LIDSNPEKFLKSMDKDVSKVKVLSVGEQIEF